jgi:hypothetical protein
MMTIVFNDSRLQKAEWMGKFTQTYEQKPFPAGAKPGHRNKMAATTRKLLLEGPADLKVTYNDGTEKTHKGVPADVYRNLSNKGSHYYFESVVGAFPTS